jgi:hypothetical protein
MSKLFRLATRETGQPLWRSWTLALGLALGVCTWVLLQGFTQGTGALLKQKVAGSLPDRVRVSPGTTSFGPIALGGHMDDATVKACQAIVGVQAVYRQAHCPDPVHISATYLGQTMQTDLVLDGVDPAEVHTDVAGGYTFSDKVDGDVPVMVPEADLAILNAGIAAHTSLPQLSEEALVGRHFDLDLGSSSFHPGPGHRYHCVIVGVSDQLGVSGPAVPLEWLRQHTQHPIEYHTLTLQLVAGTHFSKIVSGLEKLGLRSPDHQAIEEISLLTGGLSTLAALFSLAILVVAGVSVFSGVQLQVRDERANIGLLRALGASRKTVRRIYLIRCGLIGLAGSAAGIVGGLLSGWTLATVIHHYLNIALTRPDQIFQTSWIQIVCPCVLGVGTALLAGLWPARAASTFQPAAILRGD